MSWVFCPFNSHIWKYKATDICNESTSFLLYPAAQKRITVAITNAPISGVDALGRVSTLYTHIELFTPWSHAEMPILDNCWARDST